MSIVTFTFTIGGKHTFMNETTGTKYILWFSSSLRCRILSIDGTFVKGCISLIMKQETKAMASVVSQLGFIHMLNNNDLLVTYFYDETSLELGSTSNDCISTGLCIV